MRIDNYIDDIISDGEQSPSTETNTNEIDVNKIVDVITIKVNNALDEKIKGIENKLINQRKESNCDSTKVQSNEINSESKQGVIEKGAVSPDIRSENDNVEKH